MCVDTHSYSLYIYVYIYVCICVYIYSRVILFIPFLSWSEKWVLCILGGRVMDGDVSPVPYHFCYHVNWSNLDGILYMCVHVQPICACCVLYIKE